MRLPAMSLPSELFSLKEAAAIASVSFSAVDEYVRRGLVPVFSGGGAKGRDRMFDSVGVVCVCLARHLRERGVPRIATRQIVSVIARMTVPELRRKLLKRQRTLLVAADNSSSVLASLPEIATKLGAFASLVVIDVTYFAREVSEAAERLVAS
jgi:hypothetical protein